MATVKLWRDRDGKPIEDLPAVCMKCGAEATVRKNKQFSWYPPWVLVLLLAGVVPFAIVALVLTKRLTVETTLCERHKSYWWLYPLVATATFLLLGLIGVASLVLMGAADPNGGSDAAGYVCLATFFAMVFWLIAIAIYSMTRIKPSEITDRYIKLARVSQEFVEAVEEQEEKYEREYDARRFDDRPKSRPGYDDDDRYRGSAEDYRPR